MQKKQTSVDELIGFILEGIEEVKGNNINLLDLREIENTVGSIQKTVSKNIKDKPWHVEGSENSEWILMDYVNVVVHVFQKHVREFYDIEGLWGDAKVTVIENSLK